MGEVEKIKLPRIVIAGTASGVGKTTISVGIVAVLRNRGYRVQPFKVGPDYIDPSYLEQAAGNTCRNLDSWMASPQTVIELFNRASASADIAVIEGVMGLYDGYDGLSEQGSTAEVAKLLGAPVILIINGCSMARSAGAMALGYQAFDSDLNLAGVVINEISSGAHYRMVKDAVEHTNISVLGCLARDSQIRFKERHLGLVPAVEGGVQEKIKRLAETVEKSINIEAIIEISRSALPLKLPSTSIFPKKRADNRGVCIAVAKDKAFNFYYRDNLELLEAHGAHIAYFSPLADDKLPADTSGLYIGGGFPEVFALQLAKNKQIKMAIRDSVESGMPTYAECGGLAYLSREIVDFARSNHPMVGVIPYSCKMGKSLTMGYREIKVLQDNILACQEEVLKGHEFHYSHLEGMFPSRDSFSFAYCLLGKGKQGKEGLVCKNLLASYIHLNFCGFPSLADNFVINCKKWQQGQGEKFYGQNEAN